jgi:hypothetical protein
MKLSIKETDIDGERIYLKKSKIFGWGIVHPIKIDGKINWKNLLIGGSWIRFITFSILLLLMLGAIREYTMIVRIANECLSSNVFINFG